MLKATDANGVPYPREAPRQETLTGPQSLGKACVLCNGISGDFVTMSDVWPAPEWEYRYPDRYIVHSFLSQCSPPGTLVVQIVQYGDDQPISGESVNMHVDEYRAHIESHGHWIQVTSDDSQHMAARVYHDDRRYTTYWAD